MIKRGDVIKWKSEWIEPGEENIKFVAIEDEDNGRVLVEAQIGLYINPIQCVETRMIK